MATVQRALSQRLQELIVSATRAFAESGLQGIDAEVVLALDVSGEMAPLYASGAMQDLVTSLLALSMKFDDDGVIPTFVFSERAERLADLRKDDLDDWVSRVVVPVAAKMPAGCHYAPMVDAIARRWFPREWGMPAEEKLVGDKLKKTVRVYPSLIDRRPYPFFVIVLTAGDCTDPSDTARALRRASHLPIFWQFAGVAAPGSNPRHEFLDELDRLDRRHVDNCGSFRPGDSLDPDFLFQGLLNEFPEYLRTPQVEAMLLPSERPAPAPAAVAAPVTPPPGPELARHEARVAREQRRAERAAEPSQEPIAPAAPAAPAASAAPEPPPLPFTTTPGEPPKRRVPHPTHPYLRGDALAAGMPEPELPARVPRAALPPVSVRGELPSTLQTTRPGPPPEPEDPEVRLARIRARRAARRAMLGRDES